MKTGKHTAEHTPGPWWINPKCPTQIDCGDPNNKHLGDAATYFRPIEESLANARLIAAAPDLLAALEEIAYEPLGLPETSFREWHDLATEIARAAIAKARNTAQG